MDLGLLFKSSFKGFLKSKWILLLLGSIVFATVGVFTLLFTVSNNMTSSLDRYMTSGKVHNFTVDERYKNSPEPVIDVTENPDSGSVRTYVLKYLYDPNLNGPVDVNTIYYKELVPEGTIVSSDVEKSVTSAEDAISYFRSLILRAYDQRKRESFVNAVDDQLGTKVQTLQASQSILVYSDLKSYKFVWSQGSFTEDAEKRVDQVVLSQGENITVQPTRPAIGTGAPVDCNSEKLVSTADPWTGKTSMVPAWKLCVYAPGKIGGTNFWGIADINKKYPGRYLPNNLAKGYEIVLKDQTVSQITGGEPVAFRNPTSYEAVISPAFARANNIKPVTHAELYAEGRSSAKDEDTSLHFDTRTRTIDNWVGLENSLLSIGGTQFVVVGIGTTPDYAYPIMSIKDPSVNVNTQAAVFVNKPGIERIFDVYAGSETETYLAGRFTSGTSQSVQELNDLAANFMTFDAASRPAKLVNELGTNLASLRITSLSQLAQSIGQVTIIVVVIMFALAGFILVVVIKRQITASRTTLGILEANGFPKSAIALSFSTIAAIVALVPPLLGYILGYFLQVSFFASFAPFWTLPSAPPDFSVPFMVLVIIVPALATMLIAFLVALWTLRGRIIDNVNDVTKQSSFGSSLSYVFGWLDIKSRYALAIFTSNLLKMGIIGAAITASITATSVALASVNKLEEAKAATRDVHRYSYKMDLVTPTEQGGQYGVFDYDMLGKGAVATLSQLSGIVDPQNGQTVFVADEVTDPNTYYVFNEQLNYWARRGNDYVPRKLYFSLISAEGLPFIKGMRDGSVVSVAPGPQRAREFYAYDQATKNWVKKPADFNITTASNFILDNPENLLAISQYAEPDAEIKIEDAPVNLTNGYYVYDASQSKWVRQQTWDSRLRPLSFTPPAGYELDWSRSGSWVTSPYPAFQNGSKGGYGGSVAIAACGNEVINFCTGSNLNDDSAPLNLTNWYGQNHHIQYKGVLSKIQEGLASSVKTPPAWTLAESLLPENQRNSFNANYEKLVQAFQQEVSRQATAYENSDPKPTADQRLKKIDELNKIYDPTNYLAPYLAHQLGIDAFLVGYNQVGFDQGTDMLYSHVDGYFGNYANRELARATPKFTITGLQADDANLSKFYSLPGDFALKTASYATAVANEGIVTKAPVPVYINKFMVDKYGYGTGDTISFSIENTIDASRKLLIPGEGYPQVELKVVGVVNTYQGNEILTSQQNANIMIQQGAQPDVSRLVSFNQVANDGKTAPNRFFNNVPFFFNGVLSSAKNPLALSTLNVYSQSGFYPAAASLTAGGGWNGTARKQFYVYPETFSSLESLNNSYGPSSAKTGQQVMVIAKQPGTTDPTAGLYEFDGQTKTWQKAATDAQALRVTPYGALLARSGIDNPYAFEKAFGLTPYVSIVTSGVDVAELSANVFNQVSTFIGVMLWTVLAITVFISIMFTVIMALSIIEDNKKNIATLKVLGYKNSEIASIFTRGYITPLVLAAAASIPLAILMTYLVRQFIVHFGSITAPIDIVGWEVAVAVVLVLVCFAGLFAKTLLSMRAQSALLALK